MIKAPINMAGSCDDPQGHSSKEIRLINEDYYENLPLCFEGTNTISISNTNWMLATLVSSLLLVFFKYQNYPIKELTLEAWEASSEWHPVQDSETPVMPGNGLSYV